MAQSTDGSRGKIGFQHGRHAWEVRWEGPLGTVAVVGIATKDAAIQCHGYYALLGKFFLGFLYGVYIAKIHYKKLAPQTLSYSILTVS